MSIFEHFSDVSFIQSCSTPKLALAAHASESENETHLCFAVNVGEDCPVFDGLFEFCQLSSSGSMGKAHACGI